MPSVSSPGGRVAGGILSPRSETPATVTPHALQTITSSAISCSMAARSIEKSRAVHDGSALHVEPGLDRRHLAQPLVRRRFGHR
jgi:hypothetical protein